MNKKVYIPLIIVIVATGFLVFRNNKATSTQSTKDLPKEEVAVTLDRRGFSPAVVTIQVGSAIKWRNMSGKKGTVNSDNYPTNQLHKELNLGVFNSGSSVMYTFNKPGNYGYHNQLNHDQKGEIIVKK